MASSEGASNRFVITISLILHPTTGQSFCYRRPDIFYVLSGGAGYQAPGARPFHEKTWIGKSNVKL